MKAILIALVSLTVLAIAGVAIADDPDGTLAAAKTDLNQAKTQIDAAIAKIDAEIAKPPVVTTVTQTVTATVTQTVTQTVTATTPPPPPACTPSGPLTIDGQSNVVIENKCFTDLPGYAIKVNNSSNITIRNNTFTRVGDGIYVGPVSTGPITIENNTFKDVNPVGSTPLFGYAQAIQLNQVNTPGILIQNNVVDGGRMQDIISLYKSGGTAASPALITRNRLRGCRPGGLCHEPSSDSGIMTADSGGQYIRTLENLVVEGRVGVAIAGGHHNTIERNILVALDSNGGTGIYVWDWANVGGCANNSVIGNRVRWPEAAEGDHLKDGGNCGPITQSNNIFGDTRLDGTLWGKPWSELLTLLS